MTKKSNCMCVFLFYKEKEQFHPKTGSKTGPKFLKLFKDPKGLPCMGIITFKI